jgi:hypothetical protein
MKTRADFAHTIDRLDDAGGEIVEQLAGVEDCHRRGDARIAENGFATSSSVSKSAKVVLDSCLQIGALVAGAVQLRVQHVL